MLDRYSMYKMWFPYFTTRQNSCLCRLQIRHGKLRRTSFARAKKNPSISILLVRTKNFQIQSLVNFAKSIHKENLLQCSKTWQKFTVQVSIKKSFEGNEKSESINIDLVSKRQCMVVVQILSASGRISTSYMSKR